MHAFVFNSIFWGISSLCCTFYQVALWTLGQVVESTAYVVEPYQKYPSLLDILFSFLKSQQTIGIRREVFSH